jgi:hypothetical protein
VQRLHHSYSRKHRIGTALAMLCGQDQRRDRRAPMREIMLGCRQAGDVLGSILQGRESSTLRQLDGFEKGAAPIWLAASPRF